jgi:RNA polymerase-binding transcription factor DksA
MMAKKLGVQKSAKLLEQELLELADQIDTLKEKLKNRPNYTRGVGDPRMTSWALDQVLLQQLKGRIDSLNHALDNVEKGKYGICEQCGKQINPDRLAVLLDAKLCIDCANKQ